MKILVTVKQVIDPYVKIRVKTDQTGVETQNVKMSMNPFDEIALEEAVRLRENKSATEVIAVAIGSQNSQETLRHALALGADRAILVQSNKKNCSLNIAKILQKIISNEKPELVLMGKQSIDGDHCQTPQMLAALLNWSQATFASSLVIENQTIQVTREIDGGLETLSMHLPAIVSTDLRLNEPRYASLPNIMKAKQKPLEVIELESLGLNLKEHVHILATKPPIVRQGGVKLTSVAELAKILRKDIG